ncbi:hypothetical protein QFZ79_001856 [Arthrobacter sp. V4I6]|uniref:hypothetical protein n=1 Tax=unclassified Arthrobacter TaxID=235627 RepID=UPI002781C4EB|nr:MULTISPECIES: hypothetical protein [unclassified Arthrobacter]MDQ0819564.1 hypothetical protein [Arthrobacter sp. V1I7]MDQ0853745.1 hypothetical protein [Arthrobacter sp. V4I6]
MCRFHIEDPVRFNTSLKVSIEHGKHADHAELPPVEERLPRRWPEHGLWDEEAARRISINTMRTWETNDQ